MNVHVDLAHSSSHDTLWLVPTFPWTTATVAGRSMEPILREGDAVIIRRGPEISIGDVVVLRRPDRPELIVVKRATRRLDDGRWWVEGDNQSASHDSWVFGEVDNASIVGRVVLRYRPGRPQRLRRTRP